REDAFCGGGGPGPEVTVPNPLWLHADVSDTRPRKARRAIWERCEVHLFESFQFGAAWKVRDAFVLHRSCVSVVPASNDQGNAWIDAQVRRLPAWGQGVEHDLKLVCDCDANDCCMRRQRR